MRDGVDRSDLFETVAAVESVKFGKKDELGDLHAIFLAIDIDCQRVKSLGYSFRRAAGARTSSMMAILNIPSSALPAAMSDFRK